MKKISYFILIASGIWLTLFQCIAWILVVTIGNTRQENAGIDKTEYLNYLASLLTIVVSVLTVFASIKQLRLLNKIAKAK